MNMTTYAIVCLHKKWMAKWKLFYSHESLPVGIKKIK